MTVLKYENYDILSAATAAKMIEQLIGKPTSVFSMASGSSTELCYALFAKEVLSKGIDASQATFIGLDEWVGVLPSNPGSCHWFFTNILFNPLQLKANQFHLFDGMSQDLQEECQIMDAFITNKGGIDMMIVGIGLNGHIGFNEPGVDPEYKSHVIQLEEQTRLTGQKYFGGPTVLEKGITLGLHYFMGAKTSIIMANGNHKTAILQKTIEGERDLNVPATCIQEHKNGFIMADWEAIKK